jgi:hypothetical protein
MPSRIYSDPNRIARSPQIVQNVINEPGITPSITVNNPLKSINIPLREPEKDINIASNVHKHQKEPTPTLTANTHSHASNNDTPIDTNKAPYISAHNYTITPNISVSNNTSPDIEQNNTLITPNISVSNNTSPDIEQNNTLGTIKTTINDLKDNFQKEVNDSIVENEHKIVQIDEQLLIKTVNTIINLEKDILSNVKLKFDLINIGPGTPTHRKDFLGYKDYTCTDLNSQIYKGITEVEIHEESIPASLPPDIRNIILHYPYLELKKFDCVDVHHDDFKPSPISIHIIEGEKVNLITLKNVTVTMDLSYILEE